MGEHTAPESGMAEAFPAFRGWLAQSLLPGDVAQYELQLGSIRGRIVASQLTVRDPQQHELLGMMSAPAWSGRSLDALRADLHGWLDMVLDHAEALGSPFR